MSTEDMDLDEFLNFKSREFDGDGEFLRWRDPNKPSKADVWLHTRAGFVQLYRHPFKRIVAVEDDGETKKMVWTQRIVSIEPLDVLRRQTHRDRDTGERKFPPTICPVSLLIEEVRRKIRDGDLELEDPLFEFEGTEETVVIHAGGFAGLFNDKLSDDEKRRLKKAGIYLKDAWKENATAKNEWIFRVVDNDAPDKGVQIAFEKELLGQKVQTLISDEIESCGKQKGNPLVTPYCIRWKSDPSQREFQKRYSALRLREEPLSDEIREIICDTDPPDVSRFKEAPNYKTLRAEMEATCVVDSIDWDQIFGPVFECIDENGVFEGRGEEASKKTSRASGRTKTSKDDSGGKTSKGRRRKKTEQKPKHTPLEPCDECGTALTTEHAKSVGEGKIEITCPKCGATFEDDAPFAKRGDGDGGDKVPF